MSIDVEAALKQTLKIFNSLQTVARSHQKMLADLLTGLADLDERLTRLEERSRISPN